MSFVGRERETAWVREAARSPGLVTVWGTFGVGKTRLVHEALGADAIDCVLEGATTLQDVVPIVVRALGATADASGPYEESLARARSRAKQRPLLFDGADGAMDAVRALLPCLLGDELAAPVVVTACRELGFPAERSLELEPLPPSDALAMWRELTRARGHHGDARLAEEIVERLERVPLALTWFAVRVAVVGDRAALQQLSEDETTSPLTTALDATLDTLGRSEREALHRLVAFERGASAEVLRAQLDVDVATLESLMRSSLVHAVHRAPLPPRLRAYRAVVSRVRARAEESGRLRSDLARHAEVVLSLHARPLVYDVGDGGAELADAGPELRAIVQRFAAHDPRLALRAQVLCVPLDVRDGTAREAARIVADLRARAENLGNFAGMAHLASGILLRRAGDAAAARVELRHALAIDGPHRFETRIELAALDRVQSKLDDALTGYREALAWAEESNDPRLLAVARGELGRVLQSLGKNREAQGLHVEAIAIAHQAGLRHREALERSLHARATHRAGDVHAAIPMHERALASHLALSDVRLAAAERGHLAYCFHELGDLARAEAHFRAAADGLADAGDIALEAIERMLLARVLVDDARYAEARIELALAAQLMKPVGSPRLLLTHALIDGFVSLGEGKPDGARRAWEAALAHGVLFEVGFEALLPAYVAWVRALLGTGEPAAPDGALRSAALFEACSTALGRIGDSGLDAARETLRCAVAGEPLPDVPRTLLARSREARQALALAGRIGRSASLVIAHDARTAVLPSGATVDLARRNAPRLLLLALAHARDETPGRPLSHDELIGAGWPGERMLPEAAEKRLRTAIWTLRAAGLEAVLLTREDGYLLDPYVPLRWAAPRDV